jgi:CheY-like chemotaxis protein
MKILIVEDSPDAVEPLIAFLHLCGYQTSLAHTAPTALELAAAFRPDLVLLDIGLPAIDGWTLGALLRGLPGLADLPIIALTGYNLPADRQKSVGANFQYHLAKPIDYTMLGQLIKPFEPISDEPMGGHAETTVLGTGHQAPSGQAAGENLTRLPDSPADSD